MNNKILKITTTAIFIIIFVVFYKALQDTNIYTPKKKLIMKFHYFLQTYFIQTNKLIHLNFLN